MRTRSGACLWIAASAVALSGCGGPRLIQAYTVREDQLVFAVQEGSEYSLGHCKRGPDGDLDACRLDPVEFE